MNKNKKDTQIKEIILKEEEIKLGRIVVKEEGYDKTNKKPLCTCKNASKPAVTDL